MVSNLQMVKWLLKFPTGVQINFFNDELLCQFYYTSQICDFDAKQLVGSWKSYKPGPGPFTKYREKTFWEINFVH